MKQTKFKALVYGGMYVNVNLLEKGIYCCSKPYLYNMDETIETLTEKFKNIENVYSVSDSYFENLKQCKMVELFISKVDNSENEIIK